VALRLELEGLQIVLTVRDNGRGLPPGALTSSYGFRGMRERAMLIGAQLVIDEPPGGETEVQLCIPVEPPA
jgi:two-component system sensor histidine kinase UhpB